MKTLLPIPVLVAMILAATVRSGLSQWTVYTSRSAFEGALLSSTTVTFEELPSTTHDFPWEWSVSSSGIIVTNPYPMLVVTGDAFYPITGTGKYLWNFDGGAPLTILLPEGVTAFGADFSGGLEPVTSFNATLTLNLVSGESRDINFTGPRNEWMFFGVTLAEPVSSVIFDDGGSWLHEECLDNVTYGVAIPEPKGLSLLAVGALVLTWRLWRREGAAAGRAPA